eukprot:scaffold60692_cov63-Phaeocystis_antarctica.AAC.2
MRAVRGHDEVGPRPQPQLLAEGHLPSRRRHHAHRAAPAAQLGSQRTDQFGLLGEVAPAGALQPGARARHQQRLTRRTLRAAQSLATLAADAAHEPGLLPHRLGRRLVSPVGARCRRGAEALAAGGRRRVGRDEAHPW